MNFLNSLLFPDAPPGTSLQSTDLHLRGTFPLWLAVALLAVGIGLAFFTYLKETAPLPRIRRGLLIGLRTLVIGLVVLLLLRPVVVGEFRGEKQLGVAVLLDNTQSMKQQDKRISQADKLRVAIANGLVPARTSITDAKALASIPAKTPAKPERGEIVKAVLENPEIKLLDGMAKLGPTRLYTFGQQLRRVTDEPGQTPAARLLSEFKAVEGRTVLADSINEILTSKDTDLPGAIIVITDGQDNASKVPLDEVAAECGRLRVPLYIYGVGASEGGSLQFKDVVIPDTIFYDDVLSVPVRWRVRGLKQGLAVITLKLGDKVVATREVLIKEGEDLRETLSFIPRKKGSEREEKMDLTATIQLKGSDEYKDEWKRPLQLIDRKVKVLVVEHTARWEYKFLQPMLMRDRRVEASFVLISGDPRLMQGGPPFLPVFPPREKLFGYDLLILGDVPSSYLDAEKMAAIQDFVREGGGLVVISGRNYAPASFDNTPLAEVLPVEFRPTKFSADTEARPQMYLPVLTAAGERSDMLMLADTPEDNVKTWKTLPGWYWHYPVTKLRPGATALLVHPTAKLPEDQQPMPVMASHYYGKGQVVFMASEETWRWRANAADKFFPRFWGQVIYQLGLPHLLGNAKKSQLALEQSEAVVGTPGYVHAKLFDSEFRPLKDEKIPATLEALDPKPGQERLRSIMLEMVPGQPGEYRALLANDAPGRFELKLGGSDGTVLPYRVNLPPRSEQETLGMAEESLRNAAHASGGKFYREEDLYRLGSEIEARKAPFTQRQEALLWGPLAMVLFVALATAEWIVRKFSNLS